MLRFKTSRERFEVCVGNILVAESYFGVWGPDIISDSIYVGLLRLQTFEGFRNKGYMKHLLDNVFRVVKDEMNIDVILLNVYRDNEPALNLYFKTGFEVYKGYDEYYTLIKRLK